MVTANEQSGGLVARGLAAIRSKKSLHPIDQTRQTKSTADAVVFYNRGVGYARQNQYDGSSLFGVGSGVLPLAGRVGATHLAAVSWFG